MEIITKPIASVDVDSMASKVFMEAINLAGGLRRIIEYRNLTWVPSLAEAAYAVVLKNEALKTTREIAAELGVTPQTIENILSADPEEVRKYIAGEKLEIDEHIAGGLAKLAYQKLKKENRLVAAEISKEEAEHIERALNVDVAWAIFVLSRIKGVDFPADKEVLKEKIGDLEVKGRRLNEVLEELEYPIRSPAELLHKIKSKL